MYSYEYLDGYKDVEKNYTAATVPDTVGVPQLAEGKYVDSGGTTVTVVVDPAATDRPSGISSQRV